MERYYDGDQDKFFRDAHVINPFNKPAPAVKPKTKRSGPEECDICLESLSTTVRVYFIFPLII